MDACDAYSRAHELYLKAQKENPKTRAEYVAVQDAECRHRLRTLFARAASGAVDTPPPDAVVPSMEAEPSYPDDESPSATARRIRLRKGLVAVPVKTDEVGMEPRMVEPALPQAKRRTWLGRLFRGERKEPRQVFSEDAAGADDSSYPGMRPVRVAPEDETLPGGPERPPLKRPSLPTPMATPMPALAASASDATLSRKVQAMLADGAGADAVMLLESIVEGSGQEPTLAQQLLFAQALLHRRNYVRAERVLTSVLETHGDDPSCLMLAAGLRLAQGQPVVALRLLDRLVQKYPRYADAYINLAYTRFAMDPTENRDEAIKYYQHALILGADRDPRLETELRIAIEP